MNRLALFLLIVVVPLFSSERADSLREAGKSLEAINLYNQEIVSAIEQGNDEDLITSMTGRLLAWKHLFYKTKEPVYAIFLKHQAAALEEIIDKKEILGRAHLVHFIKATAAQNLGELEVAEREYGLSVELYPSDAAEKGDWIAHWGFIIALQGNIEEGASKILMGISWIDERSDQIDSFIRNVWVSGAYLRLAQIYKEAEPIKSAHYLAQAKAIIDSDERLVIRKTQLESLL